MKKFIKENAKGFTLIELLVVIAILAVLATLYVPKIVTSASDAKKTVDIANARTLASEITLYNYQQASASFRITGSDTDLKSGTTVVSKFPGCSALVADDIKDFDKNTTALSGSATQQEQDAAAAADNKVKDLLTGRTFPSVENIRIVINDTTGEAFIANTDGSAYAGE